MPMVDFGQQGELLGQWFKTPLGAALLQAEERLIMRRLEHCFGDRLLQMSINDELDICVGNRLQHAFTLSPNAAPKRAQASCNFEALALPEGSIDVVVLHHVLEFCADPHQVLREIKRVLIPSGKLFVISINPSSLLAARFKLASIIGKQHFSRQSIGSHRLHDWLELLEMPTLGSQSGFHQLPINNDNFLNWQSRFACFAQQHSMPMGGVFMLEAVKQIHGMTPIKPKRMAWRPELSGLRPSPMPAPSTKTIH
ncbi:MAG: SAM-dependent methyltransferase [Chitinophagales bacterium]|jgi:SAM-dependent methyltransferase